MQILKDLYQVGGDLNGLTWAGMDAGYNDSNTYVLKTSEGLILFDCGCGETLGQIFRSRYQPPYERSRCGHEQSSSNSMARDIAHHNAKAGAVFILTGEKVKVVPTSLVTVDALGSNIKTA